MIALPGIVVQAKIYESSSSLVYRGIREQDNLAIILKRLKQDYPTPGEVARYMQEYNIIQSLNLEGVIQTYGLQDYQRSPVILLEDFGGQSLEQWMQVSPETYCPMSLPSFLQIAIRITEILGRIHSANVIHKDIHPGNIVLNSDGVVKIIDFGIATRLNRINPVFKNPNVIEGTLAYISPEQTGRMNRLLDYRTDFYSLGVTFYRMITGQLPFNTTDVLELVHCHTAKRPIPPCEKRGIESCPQAVSNLVMKLMAKNAEDRYQSAWSIKADLEECFRQLNASDQIKVFPLGTGDRSDWFQIPQKLYGREAEISVLLATFEDVVQRDENITFSSFQPSASCRSKLLLVVGYSGIGKSSLVYEIHKPITEKRGYFISGKFDQFQRDIPYSAVVSAFQELVQQLLSESVEQLQRWQTKLLEVLGTNGQLIIDVIPEVELIIGEQPTVSEVGLTESQNRFNLVFQKFIRVFCSQEHPLVIFLDDLQWADSATLKLIELMLSDSEMQSLFLIGAYRDNEVCPIHPLMSTLERLEHNGTDIQKITLTPLKLEPIAQLIAETLHDTPEAIAPLAALVHQKTEGNPFFVIEFLKTLYAEYLITFDVEYRCWRWDVAQIEARNITDNVVELMIGKLKQLPESTQQVLRLAACIGTKFDLSTLSMICERSLLELSLELNRAIEAGLLLPASELDENLLIQNYKLLHDRVQQAAYAFIDESHKQTIHLQIGRNLLQKISPDLLQDRLFEIVDHLNVGSRASIENLPLQIYATERNQFAELNRVAGQKAKAATAYNAAVRYLTAGIEWLVEDSWLPQYDLTLSLYQEAAEAAYLCGEFEQMEQWAIVVLKNVRAVLHSMKVYEVKIQAAASQGDLKKAIGIGLFVLNQLGEFLPEEPGQAEIQSALEETASRLARHDIQALVNLPAMSHPRPRAVMDILASITSLAYTAAPNLFLLIALSEMNLSIQYGNTTWSAFGYVCYAIVLCWVVQDIETGYKYGKLALSLAERSNAKPIKAKVPSTFGASIMPWKEHLRETLPVFMEGYQNAIETGDFEFVGYYAFHSCEHSYFMGDCLTELEQKISTYSQVIQQVRRESPLNWIAILWQVVLNLLDGNKNFSHLNGDAYNEERSLPRAIAANDRSELHFCYLNKLILSYLFGEFEQAIDYAAMAERYLDGVTARVAVALFYFYDSLASLSMLAEASDSTHKAFLNRVNLNQEKMRKWAHHAPMNFLHKYNLVEAEKARVLGDFFEAEELYERAIQGAKDNQYRQEEALAYELAAKHYLSRGREKIAQTYMREAHYCYRHWGAKAKVQALEAQYPQLVSQSSVTPHSPSLYTTHSTTTGTRSSEALDLAAVIKANQAIASQIMLDQLLASLMKILIESAGAQSGFLILEKSEKWVIEASGAIDSDIDNNTYKIEVLQSIPITNQLPVSVINYVIRRKDSVVLNQATSNSQFATDSYIQNHQIKSILCAPLINQGKLVGIVYLENNLTIGAFSQQRVKVIQLLSVQAAIAITNAKLYVEVKENENRLTQYIEAIPLGVLVHNADGKLYYANQNAQQLLKIGVSPTTKTEQIADTYQVYRAGTHQLYPTDELPTVRALAGEAIKVEDVELHQADKIVPLEVLTTPIFDETGKIIRAVAAFQDITERKQAENLLADYNRTLETQVAERTVALQQQKELLQTIFDHIPVMIALYDANGQIQLVNRELERVLGWSQAELKEIDLIAECYPDPAVRQQALEHMIAATGKWRDFTIRTKDNQYLETSWTEIRLSDGMNIGIGQDISDRKRAEEASILEERNRMAREIHDTLAQAFTGIIIHARSSASKLVANPDKAQTHLLQLQDLARLGLAEARRSVEALRRPHLLEEGNLNYALNRLAAQMRASTEIQIIFEAIGTAHSLPSFVENNLLRIAQEALTNAVKYSEATEIRIELIYEPLQCTLRIKDDGQGFELNSQSTSNGFGLIGITERAARIDARLNIRSTLEQGTEVSVVVNRK